MILRRDVFQAIADPTRRAMLMFVVLKSMTEGSLASSFDKARPTVSKHLQILTQRGLLGQKKTGGKFSITLIQIK
jgi:DNA-binding transcriptional ArsR family regulator